MIRQLLLAAFPLLLAAETPGFELRVPVLGYAFDPSAQSIREITGVPGAANLSRSIALDAGVTDAFVNSSARSAIAITKEKKLAVANWQSEPKLTLLESALGGLTSAALSQNGDHAALTDGITAEVWSGLLTHPRKAASFRVDSGVTALAARNDGTAAVATADGTIVLIDPSARVSNRVIASGGSWRGLAFQGADLFAADVQAGELVKLSSVSRNPGRTVLATIGGAAEALALSADGKSAAIAAGQTILLADFGGATREVSCQCDARRLEALAGNLVFHLMRNDGGPLLLDADSGEPRILALPATNGVIAQ